MKNNKSLLNHAVKAGLFSLTLFSAAQVHAESPPTVQIMPAPHIDELYAKTDIDGDGMISVKEHYQLHTAKALMKFEMTFKAIDENGDGLAQHEEYLRFLPAMDKEALTKQYYTAAGRDEILDSEEFSIMRLKEQGENDEAMWEFATLDKDHDGKLAQHEFYGDQPEIIEPIIDPTPIEPPELIIDPTPIKPPEPVIDPTPIKPPEPVIDPTPIKPPEPVIDPTPIKPPEPVIDPTPVKPPAEPDTTQDMDEDAIKSLKEKLAKLETKLARLNKSILMTKKRFLSTSDEKKLARLERRLSRQLARLETMQDLYQATLKKLDEAQ